MKMPALQVDPSAIRTRFDPAERAVGAEQHRRLTRLSATGIGAAFNREPPIGKP